MHRVSRDRWFTLFAAVLGVSTACNHDGDAPPVTPHEAPGFSDAAVAPTPSDPTSGDAGLEEIAPSASTDGANDAAASVASAAPIDAGATTTVDTTPVAGSVPLGWLVALTRAPTPPKKSAPPKTPPTKPTSLDGIGSNCGASASCGARTIVSPPVVNVQLLLAARPGLGAADATRATDAIARMRARVTACFRRSLNQDPTLRSTRIVVRAQDAGDGKRATITVSPSIAAGCLTSVIAQGVGGDDQPTTLTFNLDVVVQER